MIRGRDKEGYNLSSLPVTIESAAQCMVFLIIAKLGCMSQPNIVFLLADDLGWADVSWNNRR